MNVRTCSRRKNKSIVEQIPDLPMYHLHHARYIGTMTYTWTYAHLSTMTREKHIPFRKFTLMTFALHPHRVHYTLGPRKTGPVGLLQFISSPDAGVFAALYDDSIYRIELADIDAFCVSTANVSARAATRSSVIAFY